MELIKTVVARWESLGKKYWVELTEETAPVYGLAPSWSYKTESGGGYLGSTGTREIMIAYLERTQCSYAPSKLKRVH